MLSLTFGVTVGATGTKTDSIKSRGNIEYDSDNDDEPEVLFYSDDLTTISTGIDSLNKQISVLSSSFDTLSDTTSQYKSAIISGLNGNVYSKANIPADTSFTELVGYINNIPAPTTAVGSYYDGGDNNGLGVGISASNPNVEVNVDGVSTINIGANESITLPSGYYPNDITIQNNVVNRSSDIPESGIISFNGEYEAGYYPAFSVDVAVNNQIAALNAETMSCSGGTYTCEAQKEILSIQKFQASTWAQVEPGEGPGPENQYTHGWSCSGRLYIKRTDGTEETITQQNAGLYASGYYGYAVNGLVELNQGDKLIAEYRGYMPLPPWTHSVSNNVSFQAYGVRFK
ncbi:hypothetical protein bhn_II025 (plasmid) [Butyrivibrio hungatei]|uniref:Uncharacterized protein n=2 Tax=Butyrivibrio hungatei TaxID=185008 RepID=A0A1D9P685_9FIRM|nr:hypothetical protein bhn_II025 [Butyrivibrio hungatei]